MELIADEKTGFKKTEVGWIPEEWEVKSLNEIATVATGNTPPTNDRRNYGGPYLFVSPADLSERVYIRDTLKKLSVRGFRNARKFPKNSTLFTCIGSTIGKTGIAGLELTSNQQINAVFPSETIDSVYTYYILTFRAKAIKELAGNQAVPIINKSQFQNTKIPLPPTLKEQQAIAEALSDVDDLIRSLDSQIEKKTAIKKGTMQQLLTGKKRLPGFHGEWEVKKLGEIAQIRNHKVLPASIGAKTPCIELENIEQNTGRILRFNTASNTSATKYSFIKGDVLFGRLRPYLKKYWLAECDGICTTEIWPMKVDKSQIIGGFLYAHVQTDKFIGTADISYGTHMPRADWKVLSEYEVQLPGKKEQEAICHVHTDMDKELQSLQQKREKYALIKQGMMQELLTGRVRLV